MFYDSYFKKKRHANVSSAGRWNVRRLTDRYVEFLREANALSGEVLELGPGEGDMALRLRAAGLNYCAVDRSPSLVAKLRSEGFEVHEGGVPPVPIQEREFDLICCLALLEHMPTYDHAIDLIAECQRLLRPGGVLLIVVPDYLRCGIDFVNWDYTHAFAVTSVRLHQVLTDGDFDVERVAGLTGSIAHRALRFPIDLLGFAVHTRFVYWLAASLGLEKLTNGFHKTFQPTLVAVARKPPHADND